MKQNKKNDLKLLLSSNEVVGNIIREVAGLESRLELLITRYFTAQERFSEFRRLLVERFNFSQKIDILRKMELPKKMISQPNAVIALEKFRKLRNILSHNSFLGDKEVHSIHSDNQLRSLLENYPKNFNKEIGNTSNRLNRLLYSYIVRKTKIKKSNKSIH